MNNKKGSIVLISGPSGVGKGSIVNELLKFHELKLKYAISATTRPKRINEQEGIHYFFKTKEQFEKMIENNELLEYAMYVGNYYGTPMSQVEDILNSGYNLLLEIECLGAMQVLNKFSDTLSIFITPPSFEELRNRLKKRNSETDTMIDKRIEQAKNELDLYSRKYKYILMNDVLNETIKNIYNILFQEVINK
ncbi:guanylate kinase [Mycoplasmoides alvi]|uniref:guanylate kinase n=1 Tax=Mycoplasmoides alvi TaxID=78580 RepID=UPI00051C27E4|nr:guanylate kinase [Mycoplasmoides alvi]